MDHEYEGETFIEKEMREQLPPPAQGTLALICSFPQVFANCSFTYQVRFNFRQKIYIIIMKILCKKGIGKW